MQVIAPALRGTGDDTPQILSPDCTNCGRCIDVCAENVFTFTHRLEKAPATGCAKQAKPPSTSQHAA